MLLPFRRSQTSGRFTRESGHLAPDLALDSGRLLLPMDYFRDVAASDSQAPGDKALNAAIFGERVERRDGNLLGQQVVLITMHLYECVGIGVKRKMPPKRKNIDGLPEMARKLVAFRKRLGLTQEELTVLLYPEESEPKKKQSLLSAWESGTIPGTSGYGRLIRVAGQRGAEDYRAYFLDQVRRTLINDGIPLDELPEPQDRAIEARRRHTA